MSCVGCGKKLKRDTICKSCSNKLWHEVPLSNNYIKRQAEITYFRALGILKKLNNPKCIPMYLLGEHTSEIAEYRDEYEDIVNKGINGLTLPDVYYTNRFYKELKRDRLKKWNNERFDGDIYRGGKLIKAPLANNMKRICRRCKVKKPLDIKHFYGRRHQSGVSEDEANKLNAYDKKWMLGHVCRECFNSQILAMKELKRLKINIGGLKGLQNYNSRISYRHRLLFLKAGRMLVNLKQIKKEMEDESNNKDVYGEQRAYEKNHEEQLGINPNHSSAAGI